MKDKNNKDKEKEKLEIDVLELMKSTEKLINENKEKQDSKETD